MKWHRRADGSYVSDKDYVILHEGPNWVSNRSDTEPIPGWNSNSSLALAKMNCELDFAKNQPMMTHNNRFGASAIFNVRAMETYNEAYRITGNEASALAELYYEALREDWARRAVAAAGKDWATHMAKFDGTVVKR